MLATINKVIDEDVRPYLSGHGGDIEVMSVQDGVVTVRLSGNCSGCPSARLTIEDIVEIALIQNIPGIKKVVLESNISEDMIIFAKKLLDGNPRRQ